MKRKWTIDDDNYLKLYYANTDLSLIEQYLNRTRYAIIDRAVKFLNLKRNKSIQSLKTRAEKRRSSFNESYFETINTMDKSYWYGFIWADGCISDIGRLSLHLSKIDIDVLSEFKNAIKSTQPIAIYKHSCKFSLCCGKFGKMKTDLNMLNIVPRKTYKHLRPKISNELFPSFLLGLFDGDGHIRKYNFSITNTEETCKFIKEMLNGLYGINSFVKSRRETCAWTVSVYKTQDIRMLYRIMYQKNSTFFLYRKKVEFLKHNYHL